MNCLYPEALQRSHVIDISQFITQIFEDFPIPVARRDSVVVFEVLFKIGLHPIVGDERGINVEQEKKIVWVLHLVCVCAFGASCDRASLTRRPGPSVFACRRFCGYASRALGTPGSNLNGSSAPSPRLRYCDA